MATCGRITFTASTMTYPLMIVHCDVDRRIEYQAFVSGRLREREGMISFRGPCTATNHEGAPNGRSPSRIEQDQTRLSPRGRAECTRASRLDVNSHIETCRPALSMSVHQGWSQLVDATLYLKEEMECM